MPFPFYQRDRKEVQNPELPPAALDGLEDWTGYEADSDLEAAVNVALLLGQPLLLTGEPGTGKTQLAFHISRQFGWGDPLVFEAKSTSTYRDLFYTYDALGRFHAKDIEGAPRDARDYIEYNALGRAILRTLPRDRVEPYIREDAVHDGPKSSVVLIDEIDKAPRDFPNDILREVENRYFKVPEINLQEIQASSDPQVRVVTVITSNSEKNLPPAFLRRCTFFHIKPPDPTKMKNILSNRLGELAKGNEFYTNAIAFYDKLRLAGLDKPPATAELLAWVAYLKARGISSFDRANEIELRNSLSVLVKSEDDIKRASIITITTPSSSPA